MSIPGTALKEMQIACQSQPILSDAGKRLLSRNAVLGAATAVAAECVGRSEMQRPRDAFGRLPGRWPGAV
jgi:hypothetical protein